MRSLRIGSFAIVFLWSGWGFFWFRHAWYLHKWKYFSQTSWKHGSAGLGPVKIAW